MKIKNFSVLSQPMDDGLAELPGCAKITAFILPCPPGQIHAMMHTHTLHTHAEFAGVSIDTHVSSQWTSSETHTISGSTRHLKYRKVTRVCKDRISKSRQ